MRTRELAVTGAFEFTPVVHGDQRGLFVSPLQEAPFLAAVGRPFPVAQTNHSRSARGVLRGIHFTTAPPGQAKYVHCARGRALDVVVDLRLGSPTFGAWDTVDMDEGTCTAAYYPEGVGHAFLALEDDTVMSYLVTTAYRAEREQAITPLDAELSLPWPKDFDLVLSERDRLAPGLAEATAQGLLPRYADCVRS
ncbi:dTDP-4-dehydrorhamnose 3,5-epimerase [Streptomyces sp. NPDC020362]|uniref:dTDP-4-dehydrorhamnose 3,5-epimerase family protein n=1 Tax=unclassified Streptomyces TaxID=2593676 RepID=UPI000A742F00